MRVIKFKIFLLLKPISIISDIPKIRKPKFTDKKRFAIENFLCPTPQRQKKLEN